MAPGIGSSVSKRSGTPRGTWAKTANPSSSVIPSSVPGMSSLLWSRVTWSLTPGSPGSPASCLPLELMSSNTNTQVLPGVARHCLSLRPSASMTSTHSKAMQHFPHKVPTCSSLQVHQIRKILAKVPTIIFNACQAVAAGCKAAVLVFLIPAVGNVITVLPAAIHVNVPQHPTTEQSSYFSEH